MMVRKIFVACIDTLEITFFQTNASVNLLIIITANWPSFLFNLF